MLYRDAYIQNGYVMADSGEVTFDVNLRDPISELWFYFNNTNGATHNVANFLAECISAIEIIDGSKVLCSLDGRQALALACFEMGAMPYQVVSELPGNPVEFAVPIRFGRWLYDPDLAFDPTRFLNPQIRVKWDMAAINAVGATGYLSDYGRLTIIAKVMEGGASPTGLLVPKEQYSFTSAASGITYIDLPTDYPYRSLLIRAAKASSYWDQILSHLKLNCDAEKYIPFDLDGFDFLFNSLRENGRFSYRHVFHAKSGDTIYPLLKYEENVNLISEQFNDCVFKYPNYGYGNAAITMYVAGAASSNYNNVGAMVQGSCPFGYAFNPFGEPTDPSTWFPAAQFKSVRLELTNATADATADVVSVQAMPY